MQSVNQKGIAHLGGLLLVVLVVAIVGFAGWYVLSAQKDDTTDNSTNTTQEAGDEISNEQDLERVEQQLEDTNLDEDLDTAELDAAEQSLL